MSVSACDNKTMMSVTRCLRSCAVTLRRREIVSVRHSLLEVCSRRASSTSTAVPGIQRLSDMYIAEERGSQFAADYRLYFKDAGGPISPLHDIPLWAAGGGAGVARLANMVVEVPRWSNAKMEISLSEPLNPIKQDVKKGAMRFVANVFPHHGYIWNYGALPQTWEDPRHVDPDTGAKGDNDPIDVLEIGTRVARRGDVVPVKILGTLALIDEGETDWKLLAIDARDPLAAELGGPADVERLLPGLLRATVEWFRLYKVPDGKPVNRFAFDAQPKDAEFAHRIIDEVHGFWRELVSGQAGVDDISTVNVSVSGSAARVERSAAAAELARAPPPAPPASVPPAVDKWHFLSAL